MKIATPAFFMPTRTVLIDDDALYIENIADLLPAELFPTVIQPDDLQGVGDAHLFCLPGANNTYNFSSISSLLKYFKDNLRSPPISVLIVDHCMRPKNGLEILENIKSPFVKKILISNLVSKDVVIEAVNSGVIDYYIAKIDRHFIEKLTDTIKTAQSEFFRQLSTLFPDFYCEDNPLLEAETARIFELVQNQYKARYYAPSNPFRRFIFSNDALDREVEIDILPEEHVNALTSSYFAESTPNEIIELIKSGATLPCFENDRLPDGKIWHKFLRAAQVFQGKKKYFYSVHKDPS